MKRWMWWMVGAVALIVLAGLAAAWIRHAVWLEESGFR